MLPAHLRLAATFRKPPFQGGWKKHDVARQLLTELTQGGYAEVSRRAREMLAES